MTSIKVNYRGKIREIEEWPSSMDNFRDQCDQKFAEWRLFDNASSRWSELNSDPSKLSSFLSQSIASQHQNDNQSQAAGAADQEIDWYDMTVCYEDSDGDLNCISDDEDLECGKTYTQMQAKSRMKLTILERTTIQQIRQEQDEPGSNNRSSTWQQLSTTKKDKDAGQLPKKVQKAIKTLVERKVMEHCGNQSVVPAQQAAPVINQQQFMAPQFSLGDSQIVQPNQMQMPQMPQMLQMPQVQQQFQQPAPLPQMPNLNMNQLPQLGNLPPLMGQSGRLPQVENAGFPNQAPGLMMDPEMSMIQPTGAGTDRSFDEMSQEMFGQSGNNMMRPPQF